MKIKLILLIAVFLVFIQSSAVLAEGDKVTEFPNYREGLENIEIDQNEVLGWIDVKVTDIYNFVKGLMISISSKYGMILGGGLLVVGILGFIINAKKMLKIIVVMASSISLGITLILHWPQLWRMFVDWIQK